MKNPGQKHITALKRLLRYLARHDCRLTDKGFEQATIREATRLHRGLRPYKVRWDETSPFQMKEH